MNNIWIATDWHLWNEATDSRHKFRSISNLGRLSDNYTRDIDANDLFIHLGDICDPAVTDIVKLKSIVSSIPGYKILCRGNHDTQDDDFYKEIGFDVVCDVCIIHNLIFSHKPLRVPMNMINIHGHLHTRKLSTLGYQHVNAYDSNYYDRPSLVDDLLSKAIIQLPEEYADTNLQHVEEKFEKYTSLENDQYLNIVNMTDRVTLAPVDEAAATFEIMKINQINTPKEFNTWMKSNIRYANFNRLKTDAQVLKDHCGSCHDQVAFAYPVLRRMGVNPRILFLIAYKPETNQGGMTHSLIYWEDKNDIYWFENAWDGAQGIHKFQSLDALKNDIKMRYDKMPGAKQFPELEFRKTSISRFVPGSNLSQFVNSIMGNDDINESYDGKDVEATEENRVSIFANVDIQGFDYIESTVSAFAELIQSPVTEVKVIVQSGKVLYARGISKYTFGTYDKDEDIVYLLDPSEVPEEINYSNLAIHEICHMILYHLNPELDDNISEGICIYWAKSHLQELITLGNRLNDSNYYSEYEPMINLITSSVDEYGDDIIRQISQGMLSPWNLIEESACNSKDQLDEILFQDISDTEYFENDDEYKPSHHKKEPMAEATSQQSADTYFYLSIDSMDDELYPVGKMLTGSVSDYVEYIRREVLNIRQTKYEIPGTYYVHTLESGYYEIRHSDEWCGGYWSKDKINMKMIGQVYISEDAWDWIQVNNESAILESSYATEKKGFHSDKFDSSKFKIYTAPKDAKTILAAKNIKSCGIRNPEKTIKTDKMVDDDHTYKALGIFCIDIVNNMIAGFGYVYDDLLADLNVLSKYRGNSIADEIVKYAKSHGGEYLGVADSNTVAIHLYQKQGFKEYLYDKKAKMRYFSLSGKCHPGDEEITEKIKERNLNETVTFDDIKNIVDKIPKDDHHYFYHSDEFKDSPYVIYRNAEYVTKRGKTFGAFIDVYSLDDPGTGIIVIASEPGARGSGITDKLVQSAIQFAPANIHTLYWRCDKDNTHSLNLAKRNGFILDKRETSKDKYVLKLKRSSKRKVVLSEAIDFINDKGETVPTECPECGSKVGVFMKGEPVFLCTNKKCNKYFGTVPFSNEDAASLQSMSREEQDKVAAKYGLNSPGHYDYEKEEAKKNSPEARREKLRKQRQEQLKKARKIKKHKAFVKKVKLKIPVIKNENTAVDTSETDIYDMPISEYDKLFGDQVHFFNHNKAEGSIDESTYHFKLRDHIYFKDVIDESAANDDKLYPVYVMLMHSGTALATAIKTVTKSNFSHSSISFDSTMHNMYSFGRKSDVNPLIGAFKKEDIREKFFTEKEIPYALYVVPCTKSEILSMKKRLDYFIRNSSKFSYDFTGLFKNYFGIADNPEYKWFCSRFVADILNSGRPSSEPYVVEPSLMKPEDFAHTNFAIYVTGGVLSVYNQTEVDKKTKQILRLERLRRAVESQVSNESAVLDLDPFNPFQEAVLNYQLSVMDESAVDNFIQYLKSFKVRFDHNGNVIISRREYDQLDQHFRQSVKMTKVYEKAGNLQGVKDELCKVYYMIELINQYYLSPGATTSNRVKGDLRKQMLDLRSVMLNMFQQHLKYVTTREPKFSFQSYYDNSKYGKNTEIPKTVLSAIGKSIVTTLT